MPIRETTAKAPLNPYGETKLAIERALHWYGAAYGLRYAGAALFQRGRAPIRTARSAKTTIPKPI